jgi:hypothetical protein
VREPGHVADKNIQVGLTGVSYGIGIHVIAKDQQYPRYRGPNGSEALDKGRILGRHQSGMDQIKGTARAKLGQSCLQCKRVASPWSRTSRVVVARGCGFVFVMLPLAKDFADFAAACDFWLPLSILRCATALEARVQPALGCV